MKKRILTILLALALLCALGGTALGSVGETQAALTYRNITVLLDGKTIVPVDAQGNGVEPFILDANDSVYLPVRAIGNALGLDVGWDGATNTVILKTGGEAKTGSGEPLKSNRAVTTGLTYRDIKITLDGVELIPKDVNGNVVEPFILDENDTTYLPVRGVGSALGLGVDWDPATNTVILKSGSADSSGPSAGGTQPASGDGVTYRTENIVTSAGTISAHILTVDTRDPAVNITPGVTGGKLRTTAPISEIAAAAGYPLAVITGNFMDEKTGWLPIGSIMIDGELIFTGGGISSIGIMEDGSLICGRPDIRVKIVPVSGEWPMWNATGVNVPEEEIAGNLSVLYTPFWGASFTAVPGGTILSVSGGVVNDYRTVAAGEEVPIPADGFVYIMTDEFMSYVNNTFRAAVPGERVDLEYFFFSDDVDGGFTSLDGVKHMFSGGPRLVRHGEIFTEIPEPQFNSDARFTANSSSRTCAGITADGKLLLVSAASGTIQAMREMMLALGCVEAINLDGGGSTALYYNGQTLTSGRNLANTLRIYYAG